MSATARERSPFGQLDGPAGWTKVRQRASCTEMAEMLRDGATMDEVAEACDVAPGTLRGRLSDAGWSTNGQPNTVTLPARTTVTSRPGPPHPAFLFTGQPWAARALCREVGGDIWFPEQDIAASREAKKICRRCPVARECLTAAFDRDERFGIFGGLTYKERRKLVRKQVVA